MSINKTCFILILSIFSQVWSKHDQNSKIKSIKNCFKGLAYDLQDFRKSRPYHTLQSDKLASAKYANCLPTIANTWFIQVNLSHQLSSKQNFGQKENQAAVLNLMGWDTLVSAYQWGFTLQSCWYCWLRGTKVLLQTLHYRSLPARLPGRLLPSSHLDWVQGSVLCQLTHLIPFMSCNSDPDFLACFTPCFFIFRVFETPLSISDRILFLLCMPCVKAWRCKVYHSLVRLLYLPKSHNRTCAFPPLPASWPVLQKRNRAW